MCVMLSDIKNIKTYMKEEVRIHKNKRTLEAVFNNLNKNIPNFNNQLKIVKGKIKKIQERDDLVFVDLGLKADAIIPLTEFFINGERENIKEGDEVEVFLFNLDKKGRPSASRSKALYISSETAIEEAFKNDEEISGVIFSSGKSIGIVDLNGVIGCIPVNELGERDSLNSLMMKSLKFHIINFDKKEGNIVLSRKRIIDYENLEKINTFFENHKVGDVVKGIVNNITDTAAFIKFEGVDLDGMLHGLDISWDRSSREQINPNEFLKSGQEIEVKIMKIEKETNKVSVSMKHLLPNPWIELISQYKEGQTLKAKIIEIVEYGAFLELAKGVEGLLHISELGWDKNIHEKHKSLKIGENIEVKIISIDPDKQRINLSVKELFENPCKKFDQENPKGTIVDVKITKIAKYGLFVEFQNFESLVHINEISWFNLNNQDLEEKFKIGDSLKIVYLGLEDKTNRFLLSIKQMAPNPFEKYKDKLKTGEKVPCKIIEIQRDRLIVNIFGEIDSEIRKTNLSNLITRYRIGEVINAQIISLDESNRPILSVKRIEEVEHNSYKEKAEQEASVSIASILGLAIEDIKK